MASIKVGSARYLTPRDFAGAVAFQRALFGTNAKEFLTRGQRQMLAEDLDENRDRLPYRMNVHLGSRWFSDQQARLGDLGSLVTRSQPFDGRSVFRDVAAGDGVKEDILPVAVSIFQDLLKVTFPNSRGGFRRGLRFVVGDQLFTAPPAGRDYTVVGVTDLASYASTLENPTWSRPFRRVWARVWARSKSEKFDARFRFIRGGSEMLTVMRPHEWRDEYGKPTGVGPRNIRYAIPLIEVGPFGSMGSRLGVMSRRHRPHRRRR